MTILVVDAVKWGPEQADLDYPKDVGQWIIDGFGGDASRLVSWKFQFDPQPAPDRLDAVVISGSPSSAYDDEPWIHRLMGMIRGWADQRTPMLGICFGHQILAEALGGRVEKNPKGWEAGTLEHSLNDDGVKDAVFKGVPRNFLAHQSHQDIVVELPPGARTLASSPACDCQAMAIGENIRSVQFHPEYTPEHLDFILRPRRERLKKAGVRVDEALASIRPAPDSVKILTNFDKQFIAGA